MDLKKYISVIFIVLIATATAAFEYKNNSRTGKPDLVTTNLSDIPFGKISSSRIWDWPAAGVYIKADGTVPLSADWNAGAHTITATTFAGNATTATDVINPPTAVITAAEGMLISEIYNTVPDRTKIVALWLFDQTGAVNSITDRNTIGGGTAHTVTLRDGSLTPINASTMSPGVAGLARYLVTSGTHLWDTPDADTLSFGNGTADTAVSFLVLARVTNVATAQTLIAKLDQTTGNTKQEYLMMLNSSKLLFRCYDDSTSGYIGRTYNTALTTSGVWGVYGATKSTGTTSAAIKLYLNQTQIDDTDSAAGSYTAMENKGAAVGSYRTDTSGAIEFPNGGGIAAVLIYGDELTASYVAQLATLLLSHAGTAP